MNKEELAAEAQRAVEELIEVSGCRAGQVLVVGCSTSEIVGGKIGTCGSEEAAQAVFCKHLQHCQKAWAVPCFSVLRAFKPRFGNGTRSLGKIWLGRSYRAPHASCRRFYGNGGLR